MTRPAFLAAFAALLLVAVPANGATKFGISDQQAATFVSPLYAPLHLKYARYVAPFDVMSDPTQLGRWDAWYKAATSAKQTILVSFEHSRTEGKQQQAPTVGQYQSAMKKFHRAYPRVKEINTWNEVNACQSATVTTERQPKGICKPNKAKLLNQYYGVSRKVFKNAKIIPLDVLDDNVPNAALKYIAAFKKVVKPFPKYWGIHNYSDTNRFSQKRTKALIRAIGSKGEIWDLETGGQLNVFSGSDEQKQAGAAKALGCMFYIAKKIKRIKRVYIYDFTGSAPGARFDAGLVDPDGTTTRVGYGVVVKRTARKC